MKGKTSIMIGLALVLSLVLVSGLSAQIKKDAKTGLDRLEGIVRSVDKATSTITITQVGDVKAQWQVVYNAQTAFTFRNGASALTEVKDGRRLICLGKTDSKGRLEASRVDIRDK